MEIQVFRPTVTICKFLSFHICHFITLFLNCVFITLLLFCFQCNLCCILLLVQLQCQYRLFSFFTQMNPHCGWNSHHRPNLHIVNLFPNYSSFLATVLSQNICDYFRDSHQLQICNTVKTIKLLFKNQPFVIVIIS